MMNKILSEYVSDLTRSLNLIESDKLDLIASKIIEAKKNSSYIFLLGNGGSASTPSHAAGDWGKELGLKTICLTDNTARITALANDVSYEQIFVEQLKTLLSPNDIVIIYSGSGNSKNIVQAAEYCKSNGFFSIGLTGNYKNLNGGKLARIVDLPIVVQSNSMERIEDCHLIINHIIKDYIKKLIHK